MVLSSGAPIDEHHLPSVIHAPTSSAAENAEPPIDLERRRIEAAIAAEGGDRARAAARLGMSRRTLICKMLRWQR